MKISNPIRLASRIYILISGLSLLSVSVMAIVSPQAVMDLVQVELTTTDAFSSIRGVYGGVGLTIFISLMSMLKRYPLQALLFLALFWGSYGLSRLMTILIEGELGSFGNQWMRIESFLCILAISLYLAGRKGAYVKHTYVSEDHTVSLEKVH